MKRKVIIEGNVEYLIEQQGLYKGWLQVQREFKVTVDIKNKANSGGEAWDWAQRNWDEFIPEEGPTLTVNEGENVDIISKLRWFCVTGIKDLKGKFLPITEHVPKKKAAPKKKAKKRATPLRGVTGKAKSGDRLTVVIGGSKPEPKKSEFDRMVDGADISKRKNKKIAKVLAEEETE